MLQSFTKLKLLVLKRSTLQLIHIVDTVDFDIEVDYINNPTSVFVVKDDIIQVSKGDIVIAKDELGKYIYYGVIEIYERENKKVYTSYIYKLFDENYVKSANAINNTTINFTYNQRLYNILYENFKVQPSSRLSNHYPYLYSNDPKKILSNVNLNLITSVDEKTGLSFINMEDSEEAKNIIDDIVEAFIKADVTITPKYTNNVLTLDINNINIAEPIAIKIINKTVDIQNIEIEYFKKNTNENAILFYNNGDFINNSISTYIYYLLNNNTISTDSNSLLRLLPPKTLFYKLEDVLTPAERVALAQSQIGGGDITENIKLDVRVANRTYSNNFIQNNTNPKIFDFDYFKVGRYAKLNINNVNFNTILKGYRIEKDNPFVTLYFGKQ